MKSLLLVALLGFVCLVSFSSAAAPVGTIACFEPERATSEDFSSSSGDPEEVKMMEYLAKWNLDDGKQYFLRSLIQATEHLIDLKFHAESTTRKVHRHCKKMESEEMSSSTPSDSSLARFKIKMDACMMKAKWLLNISRQAEATITAHQRLVEARRLTPCQDEYHTQPPLEPAEKYEDVHSSSSTSTSDDNDHQDVNIGMWKYEPVKGLESYAAKHPAQKSSSSDDSSGLYTSSWNWRDTRARTPKYIRKNWGAKLFKV